ncbi:hypothetical protein INT45_002217 [Circinella minor]|uniref:FAD-binding FR-type domain-containing protein n=1 Tax=Circinella minor TaxID=1195481 RepID=A0A8H7SG74_9FUNG|nr:hypothetical protein INT45_002217 [Circinella minor]
MFFISRATKTTIQRSFSTKTSTKNSYGRKYILGITACMSVFIGYKTWQWYETNMNKRLTPDRFVTLELIEKEQLSHDAYRLRLKGQKQLAENFPILSCFYIKDDNIQVMRSYTPINDPFKEGHVDLLIKRYQQGSISKMLTRAQLGDQIFVRGPIEEYPYQPNSKTEIGMIAGGTGITPMYQLIKHVLNNPNDKTERLWLIYCNKTKEDILLKKELDTLQEKHKDRLNILYVLDHPPSSSNNNNNTSLLEEKGQEVWQGGSGYITQEMIQSMLKKKENTFIFVCGPDAMLNHVSGQRARDFTQGPTTGLLGKMGFTPNQVWKLE